jgi:hypothetical protein
MSIVTIVNALITVLQLHTKVVYFCIHMAPLPLPMPELLHSTALAQPLPANASVHC